MRRAYPSVAPTSAVAPQPVTPMSTIIMNSWSTQKGIRTRLSHGEEGGALVVGGIAALAMSPAESNTMSTAVNGMQYGACRTL